MKKYTFRGTTRFEFEFKDLSEITEKNQGNIGVPHRADFYQIIIIESHNSVQEVDFKKIPVDQRHILFVGKNQVIRFDVSPSYSGKLLLFTDDFFNRTTHDTLLLKETNLFNPFSPNVVIETNAKIHKLLDLIQQEAALRTYAFQENMLRHLLSAFLIEASQISTQNYQYTENRDYLIALQFSNLVEKEYKTINKVKDYTQLMGISAKPLTHSLKSAVGKTPKEFIDDRIILEAKRLLVYSHRSIKEITFELGFDEPTNFSKFFRNNTGKSPADFKSEHIA
ncbi:helix-turn-helix domain-containing protein [Sphingobacterium haloxyli]|uniref:HTH araC/xylS-type domain-containing protein n=1 Tax=Sphingobacterium haloxyli TaxID=2100533 RepID=A0A2S9J4K1_9SPHI|nr:helix-turn-helix domain-containing protein [Sphingobacterium haloxyli]PRD47718.1 hypothetical protein C5745_07290 [Sphingobacterium haloxyli]